MSPSGPAWNEDGQPETRAVELLQRLGYAYASPESIEAERSSLRDVGLVGRLQAALNKLEPWLPGDGVHKAVWPRYAAPKGARI